MTKIYLVKLSKEDEGQFHFISPELEDEFANWVTDYQADKEYKQFSCKFVTELTEYEIELLKNRLIHRIKVRDEQ